MWPLFMIIAGVVQLWISILIALHSTRLTRQGVPIMLAISACLCLVAGFVGAVVKMGESVWR